MGRVMWILMVMVSLMIAPALHAEDQAAVNRAKDLIEGERYGDALGVLEQALQQNPAMPDLWFLQIQALKGLEKYKEAAQVGLKAHALFPVEGAFAYEVGDCAYSMGRFHHAARMWSKLYDNPRWEAIAYARSAQALRLDGKETDAAALLKEAVEKLDDPPVYLLTEYLEINRSAEEGLRVLDMLSTGDLGNREDYEALKEIYRAAGSGTFFEEAAPSGGPVIIPLRERSEFFDIGNFNQGPGDIKTQRMANPSQIVVSASLNGADERWMALDSGLEAVLIGPDTAKKMGLKSVTVAHGIGPCFRGSGSAEWVFLDSMEIGPVTYRNVPAMVVNNAAFIWKDTAGFIPMSLFGGHAVHYDRRGEELTLYPTGVDPTAVLGEGYSRLNSMWEGGRPIVGVDVQGRENVSFRLETNRHDTLIDLNTVNDMEMGHTSVGRTDQIDMEMSRGFMFPLADRGVRQPREQTTVPSKAQPVDLEGGPGGTFAGLFGTVSSGIAYNVDLVIGQSRFEMPTVAIAAIAQKPGVRVDGILGRSILNFYDMFLDPHSNVVALRHYD